MASRFAQLVDALHCESRQILHHSLRNCVALEPVHRVSITNSCLTELSYKIFLNVGIVPLRPSGVNKNLPLDIVVALPLWKTVIYGFFRRVEPWSNLWELCLGFWRGRWNRAWIRTLIRGYRRSCGLAALFLLQLFDRR